MDWISIITLIFGFVGGGVGLVGLLTLKSQKKKAAADAASADIDNAQKIVSMWEKLADKKAEADSQQITLLNNRIDELEKLVISLQKTAEKLTKALNKAKECPGAETCVALKELKKDNAG